MLEREHFLEVCCGLAQTLDAPENKTFVLLLLDTFSFLFQAYWAGDGSELLKAKRGAMARAARATPSSSAARSLLPKPAAAGHAGAGAAKSAASAKATDDPLVMARKREALLRSQTAVLSARHPNFGSQFIVKGVGGRCVSPSSPLPKCVGVAGRGCRRCVVVVVARSWFTSTPRRCC